MTTFDFTGKSVFVAGGTSGINLGIAEGFVAAGARVALMSRSPERVERAIQQLRAGGRALGFSADVRDPDATVRALSEAHERIGPIDVVVSGAAGNFAAPAAAMSSNASQAVVDIDLLGTFNVLRAAHRCFASRARAWSTSPRRSRAFRWLCRRTRARPKLESTC